jgi:hypothetical protein
MQFHLMLHYLQEQEWDVIILCENDFSAIFSYVTWVCEEKFKTAHNFHKCSIL